MEWEMIPQNRVVIQVPQIVPTDVDKRSLKIWIQLPMTWMRITPHPTKIIKGEHIVADIKRAIALNDIIPMMIIGVQSGLGQTVTYFQRRKA
jgi:hypothetical protein